MARKSVLITGAAGFIGSHLTERCLSLGWGVTAVDALTSYYDESVKRRNIEASAGHPDCTFIEGDLLQLDLGELVAGASLVFHLAAQPGVRASWSDFGLYARANIDATQRLLEAAREVALERFVLASSSSIYGDAEAMPTGEDVRPQPVSPYGVTKVAAEHMAHVYWRNFGVPTVCLRYFTVYGPRQRPDMAFNRLIAGALVGEPFAMFGDGTQTRDFTFVTDAVNGTIAAGQCGRPGRAYNLGGGSRRSMNDVLGSLGELLGSHVEREYVARQAGDARDTAADICLARQDLGYEPSFEFEAGLSAQLDWQRAMLVSLGPSH
jgi:UDP-glucose 4-epimerase